MIDLLWGKYQQQPSNAERVIWFDWKTGWR
jgi:hypothetical protein